MSTSTDPDHFFQTSSSLAETNRKAAKSANKHGCPIHVPGKILAAIPDIYCDTAIYVAESAGTARRIALDTSKVTQVYRGPTAPLTCLALSLSDSLTSQLYAGCWDKSIWSWDSKTGKAGRRYHGHTDFVKSILWLRLRHTRYKGQNRDATNVLISGSADASIIIWDAEQGTKLYTLNGHARGILDLAIDPTTCPLQSPDSTKPISIFSASSTPEIRKWHIARDLSSASESTMSTPILHHETSINALLFDADDDLWTASSDGTSKCLSRDRSWDVDMTLTHRASDYVRAIAIHESAGLVITAGRDETVRVWDRASGELVVAYEGHFDEITACLVIQLPRSSTSSAKDNALKQLTGPVVVTAGIDRTVRTWSLRGDEMDKVRKEADARKEAGTDGDDEPAEDATEVKKSMLTEDEERELAELMDD